MYSGNSGVMPVSPVPSSSNEPRGVDYYTVRQQAQYVRVAVTGAATAGHAQLCSNSVLVRLLCDSIIVVGTPSEVIYVTSRVNELGAAAITAQYMFAGAVSTLVVGLAGDAAFTPGALDMRFVIPADGMLIVTPPYPFYITGTTQALSVIGDTTAFDATFLFRAIET